MCATAMPAAPPPPTAAAHSKPCGRRVVRRQADAAAVDVAVGLGRDSGCPAGRSPPTRQSPPSPHRRATVSRSSACLLDLSPESAPMLTVPSASIWLLVTWGRRIGTRLTPTVPPCARQQAHAPAPAMFLSAVCWLEVTLTSPEALMLLASTDAVALLAPHCASAREITLALRRDRLAVAQAQRPAGLAQAVAVDDVDDAVHQQRALCIAAAAKASLAVLALLSSSGSGC